MLEEAALSLGVGEIYPEVVIATYGYQIIMRIDPSYDLLHSELDDVILDSRVQNKKNEIIQSMTVEYCPNYDEITLSFIDYLSEK